MHFCSGGFSPIGLMFTSDSFLKITEVAQIFWLVFSHGTKYVLILTKNG
jgi:hypothetical protein